MVSIIFACWFLVLHHPILEKVSANPGYFFDNSRPNEKYSCQNICKEPVVVDTFLLLTKVLCHCSGLDLPSRAFLRCESKEDDYDDCNPPTTKAPKTKECRTWVPNLPKCW
ncbi:hypothetical protein B5X24_HaOG203136 [Helicoverpa armigera]|uniref:Uncharacterized protein n=1 Tax=Helicoverpa armigera TaxID=29058 RepID=A0A2W1BRF5_HELAM|nr:hypothetical protein B5X24_HaOG203136 [Helicoverpa armigera]